MTSPLLAIESQDVRFAYGARNALDGLSLDVPAGSVFGLLGPNGSGKSTFITMLAAMERPRQGELRVFGEPPRAALRARVGTVFQENALDPLMTVAETLTLSGRLFGLSRAAIAERSQGLLGAFGLEGRLHDPVATLSGGMRRRLEVARALLHDPALVLLDEPTTGVDPDERKALWEALLGSRRDRTILLATNDLTEADAVCDQVAFLRLGRVVASGTPASLKRGLRRESLRVTWASPSEADLAALAEWEGCGEATRDGDEVHLTVDDAAAFVPRLFQLAPGAIRAVRIEASSLEDAYFQHVGTRSRTEGAP